MSKFKKWLIPVAVVCLLLAVLVGSNYAPDASIDNQGAEVPPGGLVEEEVSGELELAYNSSELNVNMPRAPPSLGEIFDPAGNPFAHRFSDVTDLRTATFIVAASDSEHKYEADYFCDGVADDVQIQAAVDALPATGGCIFLLDGTFTLANQIARAIDNVKFMGCGQATLLTLDGGTPVITAGVQDGWLFAHFATDAGGPSIATATQSAIRSVWIAGVRTDDPAAAGGGDSFLVVAAADTPAVLKARADYVGDGFQAMGDVPGDEVEINTALGVADTVILCPGTFWINNPILLGDNQSLIGAGPSSIIALRDGKNADFNLIENANPAGNTRILISRLKVDGNRANQAAGVMSCIYMNDVAPAGTVGNLGVIIEKCWLEHIRTRGIYLDGCFYSTISECHLNDCYGYSVHLSGCHYSGVVNNLVNSTRTYGIALDPNCENCSVVGNQIRGANVNISIQSESNNNVISGNTTEMGKIGIEVKSDSNTIISNTCRENGEEGIFIESPGKGNTIIGNVVNSASQSADNTDPCIRIRGDYNLIEANVCRMGILGNQPSYGIELEVVAEHNIVRNNDLYDSGKTGPILDNGVDTKFNSITFQFIQGTAFIDADGSAKGWEIDLADEYAIALGQLPLELTQVVRIKIWAVGLAAPGAGNQMALEINMNAGQDDEAYTAEAIAIVNKLNITENFAINDVIHWILTSADDADIGDLAGGDNLEVKVKFETGTNSDIDTDAIFRVVEIEYVT